MRQVTLPSGRVTSQLGLGCGPLHGGLQSAASRRLLEAAFEAGIRHFDLAPSYGLGLAEGVVGKLFGTRRDDITIATKAGIARPRRPLLMSTLRTVVKPVLGRLPGWKAAAEKVRETSAPSGHFDVDGVRESLADSMARMKVGRVDMLLLHEVTASAVTPALVALLADLKASGLADAIGMGTLREEAEEIAKSHPELAGIQQYRWNVFEPPLPSAPAGLLITHGAIGPALATAEDIANNDHSARARWSAAVDLDLTDPRVFADVLLAAAVSQNENGIVLFYTQSTDRIRHAVEVASDAALQAAGARLAETIRQEQGVSA